MRNTNLLVVATALVLWQLVSFSTHAFGVKHIVGSYDSHRAFSTRRYGSNNNNNGAAYENNIHEELCGLDEDDDCAVLFILTFHGEQQGIHTVQSYRGGRNHVLAFPSLEQASEFAELLRQQGLYEPKPTPVTVDFLDDICVRLDVEMKVVPTGVKLLPPQQTVQNLGHNLAKERFAMDRTYNLAVQEEGLVDAEASWQ